MRFSSSCARTTCSCRLRVHTANQRGESTCGFGNSVGWLVRCCRLGCLIGWCCRRGIGWWRRQSGHFGLPDLFQLLVPPLDDGLCSKFGEIFLCLDNTLLFVQRVRDLVPHFFRRQQLLLRFRLELHQLIAILAADDLGDFAHFECCL